MHSGDGSTVREQIDSRSRQLGQLCFAEQFIAGREFNLSLIATGDGPRVLPPAEIDFSAFPDGKPRIVGYAAKWDEQALGVRQHAAASSISRSPMRRCSIGCGSWPSSAGDCSLWPATPVSIFASMPKASPGFSKSTPIPVSRPTPVLPPRWPAPTSPSTAPSTGFCQDALRPRTQEPAASVQEPESVGNTVRGIPPVTNGQVLSTQYSVPSDQGANAARLAKKPKRSIATKLRSELQPTDRDDVRRIVAATGLFREAEIDVAVELVDARREKGPASGYEFAFAEQKGKVVGYICFGKNTLTVSSFDVYWIAVDPAKQGQGIGRLLLDEAERRIAAAGGTRIYIETSHRADYQATRGFYERCGYTLATVLDDFYAPGDSKAIYVKRLGPSDPA